MRSFWHPLSALIVADLGTWATPSVLRLLLGTGDGVPLYYAGDRMAPTFVHGQKITARSAGTGTVRTGRVVVAVIDGVPDLVRVVDGGPGESVQVRGDSDPADPVLVGLNEILAEIDPPTGAPGSLRRRLSRLRIDLAEATRRFDPAEEAVGAGSVQLKYDRQARHYGEVGGPEIHPPLLDRIETLFPAGCRVLVAGSGSGRECFGLARSGREVKGVDFSAAMVETATRLARERDLAVEFSRADLLDLDEPAGSLGGILFSYDVYSFIPGRRARIDLLRRMSGWLEPRGRILLSARRSRGLYERIILALQWLRAAGGEWGDSHTRYLDVDGVLRRSFVHCFGAATLAREARHAGLRVGVWDRGHVDLAPTRGDWTSRTQNLRLT